MEFYEIIPLICNSYLGVKDSWEQARLIAWSTLAPHQKHPTPLNDFMHFGWEDDKEEEEDSKPIEINSLNETIKNIERQFNNGKT